MKKTSACTSSLRLTNRRWLLASAAGRQAQGMGGNNAQMPQSHPCFNTLDLPPNTIKEALRERLPPFKSAAKSEGETSTDGQTINISTSHNIILLGFWGFGVLEGDRKVS